MSNPQGLKQMKPAATGSSYCETELLQIEHISRNIFFFFFNMGMSQILKKVWITEQIHSLKKWEKITPNRCKLLQQTYHFVFHVKIIFYVKITAHRGL